MIENRVTGHAVPAAGPSRFLVLEISFLDKNGVKIHTAVEKFGKIFKMMPITGVFPNKLLKNTQLQSGESRKLEYTMQSSLKGKISSAVLTLKFYDMADEHQGDLSMAHWTSDTVLTQKVSF
jgi:hypothetical protein